MTIAAYVRVSHSDQNEDSQIQEINRWMRQNGVDLDNLDNVTWFIDKGRSGDTLIRPRMEALKGAINAGEIKTVVCYKLDRLSRKMRHGLELICDWTEKGVRIVSVTQAIDLSGVVGKMIAMIFFAFAEGEQETRRERQKSGIMAAKLAGKRWGGSKKGTLLVVKPEQIEWVVQMKRYGRTVSYISRATGLSRQTVYRILERAEPRVETPMEVLSRLVPAEVAKLIPTGAEVAQVYPADSIDFPVPDDSTTN